MLTSAIVPAFNPVPHRGGDPRVPRRTAARAMPVPALLSAPRRDVLYGLATLDRYGRLAERAVLRALGWGAGQPLALSSLNGSVLVVPSPRASVRVGNDEYLRLPIGTRRALHLHAGDRVLLVADRPAKRLLLHPPAALDALLDLAHASLQQAGTTP